MKETELNYILYSNFELKNPTFLQHGFLHVFVT